MNMIRKNGGFTLVELIVVIAILAILAGVAVPAYSGYIKRANDAAVETELAAISTAAMAANATAGQVEKIEVDTDGAVTITLPTAATATNFDADFQTFYGKARTDLSVASMSAWTGSTYAEKGGEWTPATGWEVND